MKRRTLFDELKTRNKRLYWLRRIGLVATLVCLLPILMTQTKVRGANAWYKPLKFFMSTTLFVWSMGGQSTQNKASLPRRHGKLFLASLPSFWDKLAKRTAFYRGAQATTRASTGDWLVKKTICVFMGIV